MAHNLQAKDEDHPEGHTPDEKVAMKIQCEEVIKSMRMSANRLAKRSMVSQAALVGGVEGNIISEKMKKWDLNFPKGWAPSPHTICQSHFGMCNEPDLNLKCDIFCPSRPSFPAWCQENQAKFADAAPGADVCTVDKDASRLSEQQCQLYAKYAAEDKAVDAAKCQADGKCRWCPASAQQATNDVYSATATSLGQAANKLANMVKA